MRPQGSRRGMEAIPVRDTILKGLVNVTIKASYVAHAVRSNGGAIYGFGRRTNGRRTADWDASSETVLV